jgi:YHS domain-containing protein
MFKDPICGMMVDEKTAKYVPEIEGERTYFCSAACKSEFEAYEKDYNKSSSSSSNSCCCCNPNRYTATESLQSMHIEEEREK